ncbi:MAG: EAL domain-containing protein [Candidatus Thiodiazotropha sp. (ex Codakia rugifera)]|nr:EAL domain-containing protein [Candidatus Thiodiazotropha sp. (ex Codakia rugifera)]
MSYINNHAVVWHASDNGADIYQLPDGENLYLYYLQDETQICNVVVAILIKEDSLAYATQSVKMKDLLHSISKNIHHALTLNMELVTKEDELNAMADELSERYEELNLVYAVDESKMLSFRGLDSLRHLVTNCTDFLNIGMSALIIPDKNITIQDFNKTDPPDCPSSLLANLRDEFFSWLQTENRSVVINSIIEAVQYRVFTHTPQKIIITPVEASENNVIGMLVVINNSHKHDFTNSDRNLMEVMSKKVTKVIQANFDTLTGLENKECFEGDVKEAISQAKDQGLNHVILNIDLDHVGVINDLGGREVGDALIRQVGKIISNLVRGRDVVARLGGDEFGVLLDSCPLETGKALAQNISREISKVPFKYGDDAIDITACIGVTPITSESESVNGVLSSSEMARNAAKERGKNQIIVYEQNDIELLRRRNEMKWIGRVENAIREDRFQLHCQYIKGLKGGYESHYEILLRMLDDEDVLVLPGQFLPAAEKYHLMPEIDSWVVKQTVDKLLVVIDEQQRMPCNIAINLSGQSLSSESFHDYLYQQVQRLGTNAKHLCFEITESAAIANLSHVSQLISSIKALGCRFSLDDFGTGLSSFAYLQNLDVDFLKIDGSFVQKIESDPVAKTMVSAINQVGHAMGLNTIAEFVENQSILEQLMEMDVDFAQGFGIAKPKPFMQQLVEIFSKQQAATG